MIIELSTLAMKEKEALRAAVEKAGNVMLDAPLSGVPKMVKDRVSIIFASGDKAAYDRAKPMFDAMTDKSFYLGPFGAGTKMKFAANMGMPGSLEDEIRKSILAGVGARL